MQEDQKQKLKGIKELLKGMGGIGGWFSALLGRPRVYPPSEVNIAETSKQKVTESSEEKENFQESSLEEDSVKADIQKLRKFVSKSLQGVSLKTSPLAEKSAELGGKAVVEAKELVGKSFLKKLVKVFFIFVFMIILGFIAIKLFKTLQENGKEEVKPPEISLTPPPYQPFKPSLYAQDPEVLQLEEDIGILESELANTTIREETLFPPSLDFDVKF